MSPAASIQRFSTQDVPPAHRFDYWSNVLSKAISPMTVTSEDVLRFEARTSQTSLGPLDVNRTQGTAHTSRHTRADVEHSEEDNYHLLVSLDHPWHFAHRGQLRLAAGDVVLSDSRIEHVIDIHSSYDILNVIVPVNWLRTWIADPNGLVGRRIPRLSNWGRVLSPIVSQLVPEFVVAAPLPHVVLADHIGAVLALVAGEDRRAPCADRALLKRVEDSIDQRCTEPQLTAADIATSLKISVRALHRSLAFSGFSFATRLLHARVGRGIEMLRSSAHRALSAEQVAELSGFPDAAHFSRVIGKRLGADPSLLRPRVSRRFHGR